MIRRNVGQRPRAEGGRRLLLLRADLLEHRQDLPDHVGERHRRRGHHDPGEREHHLDAVGGQPVAEPAPPAVDEEQGEPHHHRRDGERDVDERVEQPRAREPVAGQDERHPHAEHRVGRDGDHHHHQGEPEGVERVRRRDRAPRRGQAVLEGPVEHRRHRDHHQQCQVAEGDHAERPAPAGARAAAHAASATSNLRRRAPMATRTTRAISTRTTDTAAAAGREPLWERL